MVPQRGPAAAPVLPDPVVAERDGDTLHIRFNRPARHNAFSNDARAALLEALDIARHDPSVDEVILSGNGPSFCSGGDLAEFGSLRDPASAHIARVRHSPALVLDELAARLGTRCWARVHGQVLGSGLEMAAFCGWVDGASGLGARPARDEPRIDPRRRRNRQRDAPHRPLAHGVSGAVRPHDRRADRTRLGFGRRDRVGVDRCRMTLVGSLGIPDAVFARARRVADDIAAAAADLGGALSVDADEILTGRAGLLGLAPAGRISAGGSTRLLPTRDGWCALTLSRADDIETVPALLELAEQPTDVWAALAAARRRPRCRRVRRAGPDARPACRGTR